ncbi:substrate-binding periplasmic protein [Thiorhodovibrio frisius]|uniref:Periplasmic component of amino acid ABC-type transporter/signal transduction system n=1 Tax=Thiorhodovibrio frisius TaxID=631362 RepID=H8YY32_9GAMM|nr:transporter substrate-binding domain-containing protein [Thiorhodovibrio frisius]EIC23358.1 periplasmic component of amino acid ABC-type transporter/signal transduction system [Thiorhodovibrio frisius]WPL23561.1 ABC transporter glutamine-binding protein GlnH precursor [Thiorhodovibrio frisius]
MAGSDLELHIGLARESTLPLATVEHGVLNGLAVDLSSLLGEQLGMELRLRQLPERDLIPALKGGRIDLMLSTLPNEELRALRLLPSEPVLQTGQLALVRQADLVRYTRQIDVLSTRGKVGFERGTTAARAVHQLMPQAERIPFPNAWQALVALKRGQIALLVLDALRAWNLLADPEESELAALLDPLISEHLVWTVREKDVHLLARVNTAIAQWRNDGTLERLISRWIPMRIQPAQ